MLVSLWSLASLTCGKLSKPEVSHETRRRALVRFCAARPASASSGLTRNSAISVLTSITVAPITSNVVIFQLKSCSPRRRTASQLSPLSTWTTCVTVSKAKIGALMSVLSAERMMEVEQALAFALGMPRQR